MLSNTIQKTVKYSYRILKKQYYKLLPKILFNVNKESNKQNKKRALLVYLIQPFKMNTESNRFVSHTNIWRNIEIARILGKFGYVVDVVNWNDNWKLKKDYDLIIGFGNALEKMVKRLLKQTIKIYLETGAEGTFHNQREKERIEEVNTRRSCNLKIVRKKYSDSNILKFFDALILLGNEVSASTYRPYFKKKIYCFNNHGFDRFAFFPKNKNYEE